METSHKLFLYLHDIIFKIFYIYLINKVVEYRYFHDNNKNLEYLLVNKLKIRKSLPHLAHIVLISSNDRFIVI